MDSNISHVQLSDQAISSLRSLIGERVYRIESPVFEVRKNIISADCFSIEIFRKGYLIIDYTLLETPVDHIFYWHLDARRTDHRKDERFMVVGSKRRYFAQSSIELPDSPQPILAVNIYETENLLVDRHTDTARYDDAVEFICSDGKRYCIFTSNANSYPLNFSADEEVLNFALKDSELRLSLT